MLRMSVRMTPRLQRKLQILTDIRLKLEVPGELHAKCKSLAKSKHITLKRLCNLFLADGLSNMVTLRTIACKPKLDMAEAKRFNIKLSDETHQRIQLIAAYNNVTMNEVMCDMIDQNDSLDGAPPIMLKGDPEY